MAKRPIVYIAAPFGAKTHAEREWNTQRAELLCLLAQRSGYAPICVHSGVLRGAYGDDADASDRAAGLETDVRLLDVCDEMWVLLRADGSMSDGVAVEVRAYSTAHYGTSLSQISWIPPTISDWDGWAHRMNAQGLYNRWKALRKMPAERGASFTCPDCGPKVKADEDGCCAMCGVDCDIIDSDRDALAAVVKYCTEMLSVESATPGFDAALVAVLRTIEEAREEA